MSDLQGRLVTVMGGSTNRTLIEALRTLAAMPEAEVTALHRRTHAWLIEELERRVPAAAEAVGNAYERAEIESDITGQYVDVDYVEVLAGYIERTGEQ